VAVYEIARIQIRRGRAQSGTSSGIPQLASGELAWAIDSQELYIGNGAVSEGAPSVGNTRVLTEQDLNQYGVLGQTCVNIEVFPWQPNFAYVAGATVSQDNVTYLCLVAHTSPATFDPAQLDPVTFEPIWLTTPFLFSYKKADVMTGLTINDPVVRCVIDRLSDRVSLADFTTLADVAGNDYTLPLQRAIQQLFVNAQHTAVDAANSNYRVTLEIPPGTYNITNTIYLPSYATIIGAGADKTILNFSTTSAMIGFYDDNSAIGNSTDPLFLTQARHITLKGITIKHDANLLPLNVQAGLDVNCVRNSVFEDINIEGNWDYTYAETSSGVLLSSVGAVTSQDNIFKNINISGFSNGIWAKHDILNNTFENLIIGNVQQGIMLGVGITVPVPGEMTGPTNTLISNCTFKGIARHAVYIEHGIDNCIENCTLINVGCNSFGEVDSVPVYPQIYIDTPKNVVNNIKSARTAILSDPLSILKYVPEISGTALKYSLHGNLTAAIATGDIFVGRLPIRTNSTGVAEKIINYTIDYTYDSTTADNYARRGVLNIVADFSNDSLDNLQLIDVFDYFGVDETEALTIRFSATANIDGCIDLVCHNTSAYIGTLSYTYTVIL
jgi:hypothetical protein